MDVDRWLLTVWLHFKYFTWIAAHNNNTRIAYFVNYELRNIRLRGYTVYTHVGTRSFWCSIFYSMQVIGSLRRRRRDGIIIYELCRRSATLPTLRWTRSLPAPLTRGIFYKQKHTRLIFVSCVVSWIRTRYAQSVCVLSQLLLKMFYLVLLTWW